jgi:3-phenylpropionate/trans-cinnamate dioxygenase ferredoxin reductase subunit
VVTDGHAGLPADVVVIGVGAVPDSQVAAGIEVDNGVVVDEALRSATPDGCAAGDVAPAFHLHHGRHVRVEHWANALRQGPAAARSVLGRDVVLDRVPCFSTDQYELGIEYWGLADPDTPLELLAG